jgi:hypothetical protein
MSIEQAPTSTEVRTSAPLIAVVIFGALFSIGAYFFAGARASLSVAVGAAIAAGNLYALTRIVRAFTSSPDAATSEATSSARGGLWAVFAVAKMLVLFGGIWILMMKHMVDPLPLAVGFGALPIGIALASLTPNANK